MNKIEFMKQMRCQLNIPETVSLRWVAFSAENIERGQYVDFSPKDKETAMAEWLELTYAAFYFAKRRGGEQTIKAIINASEASHMLYPREIIGTIDFLRKGGQPDQLIEASANGSLDYDGQLPVLSDVSRDIKDRRSKSHDAR